MSKLAIYGAGGHGDVVAEIAELNNFSVLFFDEKNIEDKKIEGKLTDLLINENIKDVFVAIGDNLLRENISSELKKSNKNLLTLIHPSAIISKNSSVGKGSVVMPNVVINPNTHIGEGCILNTSCVIEHHCLIGNFSHVCPSASVAGNVKVGTQVFIGNNASVNNNVVIGDKATIGSGSVIIAEVDSSKKVAGNPAREIN